MSEQENKKQTNLSANDVANIAAQAAASAVSATFSDMANNANSAALKINNKIREKQIQQQNYASKISNEMKQNVNCCIISIPATFKKYQPSFTAQINGCTVTIPADGKPYRVHNDFAVILLRRIQRLDYKISHMNEPDIAEYTKE